MTISLIYWYRAFLRNGSNGMSKKTSIRFNGGQNVFSSGARIKLSVLCEKRARNSSTALSVTTEYA